MAKQMNNLHSGIEGIVKAEVFDENWYITQYPDVSASGLTPVEHYLRYGARLRRRPHPAFDLESSCANWPSAPEKMLRPHQPVEALSDNEVLRAMLPTTEDKQARIEPEPAGSQQVGSPSGMVKESDRTKQDAELAQVSNSGRLASRFSVEQLKMKLWGGFSRYAVDCLEEVKNDCRRESPDRAEAAYCLMQWFYVAEAYSRAYENVLLYGMLCNDFLDKKFVIGSTLCLIKLQRFREANELIDTALDDRTRSAIYLSDFLFLKSSIVRRLSPGEQGEKEQLALFANAFKSMGLAPIEKNYPDAAFTFGNLTASASARTTDQRQKVSILIPAFNAAGSISYVVSSLQAQTWRNIEIIVVDDCSTDNTSDVVREIMAFEPRVKLICKPVNEGAYPARNTGLREATGDLIMVHDSDDWSHPQKLEIQIRALNKTPGAVASMSNWIRVDDEFMPSVHSRPRNTIKSLSFPSLLFKKEIVEQIGPWAAVRVSGDAEFKTRIERYYGSSAIARISKVLSISLSREGSLTQNNATHINTLHFGLRWQYLNLYDYFHSQQLKHDPDCDTCTAVNSAVIGNRSKRNEPGEGFDVVFISDFVSDGSLIKYIAAACAAGSKVAVYHWRNFEEDAALPLSKKLYELCLQYRIGLLTCCDSVHAKLAIFGNLEILRFRQDRFLSISASRVIGLLQRKPPSFSPQMHEQKILVQLKATIKTLMGKEMRLVPSSPRLASCLHELGLQRELDGEHLPPAVDILFWCDREITARVRQKTHVEIAYPSGAMPVAALAQCSPVNAQHKQEQRCADLSEDGEKVELVYKEIDVANVSASISKEMMSSADFYMYYPQTDDYSEFESGVLESLALGIPVIVPPALESVFGDSALYAHPNEAEARLLEVWHDQEQYLAYARKGREFIQSRFCHVRFSARMQKLAGMTAT
jgi:glycosyltransferase involved in cell wall biosynthesis